MMKKGLIFFIFSILLICSSCQMMTESGVEGKWKLIAVSGIYNSAWNILTYEFSAGKIYFEKTTDHRKEIFNYSMSSNQIKISGSETTNAGLVDSSYTVYSFGSNMIWYQPNTIIELYKFEKL
jgi:hypothetical protein